MSNTELYKGVQKHIDGCEDCQGIVLCTSIEILETRIVPESSAGFLE